MLRLSLALAAVSLVAAPVVAATAPKAKPKTAQCRNPKTKKFITCPPPAAPAAGVTKDKNGKCHIASGKDKGKFTTCP